MFCQPDKVHGRNNQITFCPTKQFAVDNNIPVYQPTTFKDNACLDLLVELNPDVIVVAAYGKILPSYVLKYPRFGCYNIHGSLLPKYRGASPIQQSVLNGDSVTGITIIDMNERMDEGDIVFQKTLSVGQYETSEELFDRMSILGAECIESVLEAISEGTEMPRTPQNHDIATYTTKISKEAGLLDFTTMDSASIKNLVYGLNSWPSAYFVSNGITYKVHKVLLTDRKNTASAGSICSVGKNGIEVVCSDGYTVIITEIQKQGKKKMDAYSFSLGHKVIVNENIMSI